MDNSVDSFPLQLILPCFQSRWSVSSNSSLAVWWS